MSLNPTFNGAPLRISGHPKAEDISYSGGVLQFRSFEDRMTKDRYGREKRIEVPVRHCWTTTNAVQQDDGSWLISP